MVVSSVIFFSNSWRTNSIDSWNRYCAFYLYNILTVNFFVSYLLGISAFYHDSAASLLKNGEILSAVQEERFSRKKHDNKFPINAIKYLLTEHKISLKDIDAVVFYEKPFLKFERLLETYIAFAPKGIKSFCASIPIWLREKLYQKKILW